MLGSRLAQQNRLIGLLNVERIRVYIGVDRDGFDPQQLASANHPTGDFASIGYQYL